MNKLFGILYFGTMFSIIIVSSIVTIKANQECDELLKEIAVLEEIIN